MTVDTNPPPRMKLRARFKRQVVQAVLASIAFGGVAGWLINDSMHPRQVGPVEGTLGAHLEPEAVHVMDQVAKSVENPVVVVMTSKAETHSMGETQFEGYDCFLASLRLPNGNQRIIGQWCESAVSLSLPEGQVSGYGFEQVGYSTQASE